MAIDRNETLLSEGYMIINPEPYFFINSTGSKMKAADVGNALTMAFHQSGYAKRVNCMTIRKTIVTYVHEHMPDKKGQLADHMLHRFGIADKHYKVWQKSKNTLECTNAVHGILQKESCIEEPSCSLEVDSQHSEVNYQGTSSSQSLDNVPYQKNSFGPKKTGIWFNINFRHLFPLSMRH